VTLLETYNLDGKVALVTGAGSGLGVEFAEAVAEAGGDVACADLNLGAAEQTAARVEKHGRRAIAIRADVSDEQQVATMVAETVRTLGRLDILFNNAGVADANPTPIHQMSSADWHEVIAVDLHGVFYCAREALKVIVEQGGGKIINIASMWGTAGSASIIPMPGYTAAKGAVVNLTRELGLEYAPLGVQVNALCPGFYLTKLGAYDDPEFVAAITAFTPMGRIADPAEIRGPALFLASAASNFMTGQVLVVDGGCTAK
jgi:NAD(P)-dependent dehydrogenase (short-subunit alcohol dehydrogenase family)